ncbi:MAG: sodium:proton exchanger, partial [Acidimicrobiaceae bacterium]|nr:sodium:proton exchanger [Acidimicrobiaceae bacterium]
MSASVAAVAFTIIAFALISKRIEPTIISGPMVFVAMGLLFGPQATDLVDLGLEIEAVELVGEVTLAVLLFADAGRINGRELRREYMLPARLLGIGLPLTVALGTGVLYLLIDGVGIWEAALIAAILSPTDAALGQEVVTDEAIPSRIRQGLTVESGLNDGLVVPAVALFLALSAGDGDVGDTTFWTQFVFEQIGLGVLVGVSIGAAGALLLNVGRRHDWVDGVYAQLATFSLAIASLAVALALDGNGFIAAFLAGLTFGGIAERSHHLGEFTEDAAQLAAVVSFFLFGNILLGPAIGDVTVAILVCAVASLTVVRIVPVVVALVGSGAARETRLFVGWFGPRGLAS